MRNALILGAVALICAGCGSAEDPAGAAGSGKASGKALGSQTARLSATMVQAVSADEGASAVSVKFELRQRPEVGKPVDIAVAFIPTVSLERLHARFLAGEGLELVKGGETEQIARPITGEPILHTLTVTPKRDGIFTVTAIVLMDSEAESISRNFSIPLIAGSGLGDWQPKRAVARSASYVNSPENSLSR